MGLRHIRIDRHVEARWSPFDVAQHQVLHCIQADCSTRDCVAHRGSDLIGAEYTRPARLPSAAIILAIYDSWIRQSDSLGFHRGDNCIDAQEIGSDRLSERR
jgi:hypothetical protein